MLVLINAKSSIIKVFSFNKAACIPCILYCDLSINALNDVADWELSQGCQPCKLLFSCCSNYFVDLIGKNNAPSFGVELNARNVFVGEMHN